MVFGRTTELIPETPMIYSISFETCPRLDPERSFDEHCERLCVEAPMTLGSEDDADKLYLISLPFQASGEGDQLGDLSTISDPSIVEHIIEVVKKS